MIECRDWLDFTGKVILALAGFAVAWRLERLRRLYAKNLKRYDLLHTARFKAFEEADNRLVEVQKGLFDAWKFMHRKRMDAVFEGSKAGPLINQLSQFVYAATLAKIKCEKYFDESFNGEFAVLIGQLQTAEIRIREAYEHPRYGQYKESEAGKLDQMDEAYRIAKDAVPAFRKRMGEIIQKDVEE